MIPARWLFVLLLPFSIQQLACQEQPQSPEVREKLERMRTEGVQAAEQGGAVEDDADAKKKAALGQPAVRSGASGFCRFDTAMRPKRLMPGQSGVLLITMVFEGDSVMVSPPPLQVTALNTTIQAGGWSIRPAERGTVAKAFSGQPVYDNWAVIEMPVTMASTAQLGSKQFLALDVQFDLASGSTGATLGRFNERLNVMCEVGMAKDPVVVENRPRQPAAAESKPSQPTAAELVPVAKTEPTPEAPVIRAPADTKLEPAPEVTAEHEERDAPAPQAESSSSSLLVFAGGGLLLLVVVVALLRRN